MDRIAETPTVVIDEARMRANVERMRSLAARHELTLRPHVKTHKSIELARIQQDAGAFGFTASKSEEAALFAAAEFPSITVAYPLVSDPPIERLVETARERGCELRFVIDRPEAIAAITRHVERLPEPAAVYLEIDVGLGRCGVLPGAPDLLELAGTIASSERLRFAGILSHAGHAYAASNREEVAGIAEQERTIMATVRARLESAGIAVPIVSVGSTPTVLAAESFEGIDEIRPGNYIVLDGIQVALGVARYDQVALTVLTTIVGRTATHYIVDAGSKTLSSDRGAHGAERPVGYGAAFITAIDDDADPLAVVRLSEEHGFVERRGTDLAIGTRLRIVPNHACPVVNLARELVLVGDDVRRIDVDARGCVH